MTRHVVIGTAGHIDHGKSALVRALTGTDPDRLKEEKARGITIDLGFAHWSGGGVQLAFVDVPGHERFVKNMLAGASGIDGVLLVVAADESVMPQTREHFDICRLLGVTNGVVALTKADLVDRETVELVELETADLLAGSSLEGMPVLPVSAKTGDGLEALRGALLAMAGRCGVRTAAGAARLPIDRAFTVKGFGTVVTGTLVSGRLSVDDTLAVLPAGVDVKVRGLQVHGAIQPQAVAGQRVAANFSGPGAARAARGETAVTSGAFEATSCFDAVLDLLPSARRLRHGARVRFHHGTREVLGRVALGPGLSGAAAGVDAPEALSPGGRAFVRLRLEGAAVLTRGDRFILRAYSPPLTVAGGRVLDPSPPRGGLRTAAARTRMDRLLKGLSGTEAADHDRALALLIEERGLGGLPAAALVVRGGVAPESVGTVVERLSAGGAVRRIGERLVAADALQDGGDRLLAMVADFHGAHPLRDGVPREEVRERIFRHAGPGIFEAVLERLAGDGRLTAGGHLALPGHRVTLSPAEQRASDEVVALLRTAGLRPPAPAALRERLGVDEDVLERVLRRLVREQAAVRVGPLVFHVAAIESLKADLAALKAADDRATIDVGTFKERYGVSRKFAIPLLEYLDRERLTRRVGEKRLVL